LDTISAQYQPAATIIFVIHPGAISSFDTWWVFSRMNFRLVMPMRGKPRRADDGLTSGREYSSLMAACRPAGPRPFFGWPWPRKKTRPIGFDHIAREYPRNGITSSRYRDAVGKPGRMTQKLLSSCRHLLCGLATTYRIQPACRWHLLYKSPSAARRRRLVHATHDQWV